jgi:NDP-sugar pyrophosphorylase family protein
MADESGRHKSTLALPDGRSILEWTISSYVKWGLKRFVLLVGINAHSIYDTVNALDMNNVSIMFSEDPAEGVGRGGAVKHAIESGALAKTDNMLVHNSDDVLVNYPGNFLADVCKTHIQTEALGGLATAVISNETKLPYSCMYIKSGRVISMADAPNVPIPTHVGITVFSPDVQQTFLDMFSYEKKQDFEKVIFPYLAELEKLYSFKIAKRYWYPVNNPKEYAKLVEVFDENRTG